MLWYFVRRSWTLLPPCPLLHNGARKPSSRTSERTSCRASPTHHVRQNCLIPSPRLVEVQPSHPLALLQVVDSSHRSVMFIEDIAELTCSQKGKQINSVHLSNSLFYLGTARYKASIMFFYVRLLLTMLFYLLYLKSSWRPWNEFDIPHAFDLIDSSIYIVWVHISSK